MSVLPPPPPWLGPLQAMFAEAIQSPLDASTGTFRSRASECRPELLALLTDGSEARLALYHEQYWMRLFTAMQQEFPRLAQVLGYWRFNAVATLHLQASPPIHTDMARCADRLADRVLATLDDLTQAHPEGGGVPDSRGICSLVPADATGPWIRALAQSGAPVELARQAARMDEAVRHAIGRPFPGVWRPTTEDLATLSVCRLRFAPSFRLLREDWALAERGELTERPGPFTRHETPQYWVSWRAERSTALRKVEPGLARLFRLLARLPLGQALREMEAHADEERVDRLAEVLPRWIELSLSSGWWIGVHPG